MNITTAKYLLNPMIKTEKSGILCTIDGITAIVPIDTENKEYQAVQQWVADGNTIAEADAISSDWD